MSEEGPSLSSRRKRKSAPPRRLDAAAREEQRWDLEEAKANEEAEGAREEPKGKEKEVIDLTVEQPQQVIEKPPGNVFDLLRDLEALESAEPIIVPKEKRKKSDHPPPPPPSYDIPFNTIDYYPKEKEKEKEGGEEGSKKESTKDFVEIFEVVVNCERCNDSFFNSIKSGSHHLYTRFVAEGSLSVDFVTTKGEVMASGELSNFPQPIVDSLIVLQKKGIVYLDAFPIKSSPINQMSFSVYLTASSFITCEPTDYTSRSNYALKELVDYIYYNSNVNNNSGNNNSGNNNNNNNENDNNKNNEDKNNDKNSDNINKDNSADNSSTTNETHAPLFDPLRVYVAVKPTNTEPQLDPKILSHVLVPTLRPYQLRASHWMLEREKIFDKEQLEEPEVLHPLWKELTSSDGKKFYYNDVTGALTKQKFTVKPNEFSDSIPGGILADEPGLGKTLEVLSLVLANPSDIPFEKTEEKEKGKEKGKEKVEESPERKNKRRKVEEEEEWMEERVEDTGKGKRGRGRGRGKGKGQATDKGKEKEKVEESPESKSKREEEEKMEERVEDVVNCPCGRTEGEHEEGTWVQCDLCEQWSFGACVGYFGQDEFQCENCRPAPEMLETGATLIVCPLAIREQWRQEIERHTKPGTLRVRIYNGVRNGDYTSAHALAQHDIVLTTYDVLRSEVDHLDPSGRADSLRNKKRYKIMPTPLASLIWWRICLDEAQMVESTATKAATMALHLQTKHRWCVTGTPIQRGLEDIFGLLLFLKAKPFDDRFWWMKAIQTPYEQGSDSAIQLLHNFLKPIMWRNMKSDVAHELKLPRQIEKDVKLLRFSAVESTFYRKQHEDCSAKARVILQSFAKKGSSVTDRLKSAKVLRPLLRLRQACCHPQVGGHGVRALQKNPMTMDELLDHLNMTAKVDCQEAQRAVLVTMNGLAALDIIDGNINGAAEKYRAALALIESNANVVEADKFQQLHIYHNLAEMVQIGNLNANTLNDDKFKDKAQAVRQKLVAEREYELADKRQQYNVVASKIVLDPSFYQASRSNRSVPLWWLDASAFLDRNGVFGDFLTRLMQLESNNTNATVWREITDSSGLSYTLTMAFDELFRLRNTLKEKVTELDVPITQDDVTLALSCSMCAKTERKTRGVVCKQCAVSGVIESYEKKLFAISRKEKNFLDDESDDESKKQNESDDENEDWWTKRNSVNFLGSSEYERILQVLINTIKSQDRTNPMVEAAQKHFDALTLMKEECKKMVGFIASQKDLIHMMDEVDMAITRIRLRYPGEVVHPGEESFKLFRAEVDPTRARFNAELVVHEAELKKTKGQLHYLKSLAEARKRQERRRQLAQATNNTNNNTTTTSTTNNDIININNTNSNNANSNNKDNSNTNNNNNTNNNSNITNAASDPSGNSNTNSTSTSVTTSTPAPTPSSSTKSTFSFFASPPPPPSIRSPPATSAPSPSPTESSSTPSSSIPSSSSPSSSSPSSSTPSSTPSSSTPSSSTPSSSAPPSSTPSSSSQPLVPITTSTTAETEDDEGNCPVCREAFSEDVVILTCGHTFCYECMMLMIERIHFGNTFKCPSCRTRVNIDEISYVSEGSGRKSENLLHVKGSWGTKIEAVIREILGLQNSEPGAKSLVFSQWNEVLEIISHALAENGVKYARVLGKRSIEKAINNFKKDPDTTVLLLPVASGANGLNLVEATHVFLVEPLLNPAAEAQAINRVHRIGQTKESLIHRFIIGGTIEEKVWSLGKHKAEHQQGDFWRMRAKKEHDLLTVQDLCELFADANGNI